MRIGLLSDTHVPIAPSIWPEIIEAFQGVDLILHAGDIMVGEVLDQLEAIAPVYAAEGNHDGDLAGDRRVRPLHLLNLNGRTVALLHLFEPLSAGRDWLSRLLGGTWPDVVVYGDSHFERIDVVDGALCVNPGSATMPHNRSPRLGHVGFLTIEPGEPVRAEVIDLGANGERVLCSAHQQSF